jgi:hypothetical protein
MSLTLLLINSRNILKISLNMSKLKYKKLETDKDEPIKHIVP